MNQDIVLFMRESAFEERKLFKKIHHREPTPEEVNKIAWKIIEEAKIALAIHKSAEPNLVEEKVEKLAGAMKHLNEILYHHQKRISYLEHPIRKKIVKKHRR